MNKNQFLIELNQYLTFLSPAERTEIISGYTAKFDSVPEEEEAAFILSLGTPTKIAIDLKRQKESGVEFAPAVKETEEKKEPVEAVSEAAAPAPEPEPEFKPEAENDSPDEAVQEPEAEGEAVKKRSIPASIGAFLLALLASVFFLALVGVGIYFFAIMANLLMTGLQSLSSSTNALLLFGCGLVAGALGLLLIWLAIWSAIKLIARLFRKTAWGRKA